MLLFDIIKKEMIFLNKIFCSAIFFRVLEFFQENSWHSEKIAVYYMLPLIRFSTRLSGRVFFDKWMYG